MVVKSMKSLTAIIISGVLAASPCMVCTAWGDELTAASSAVRVDDTADDSDSLDLVLLSSENATTSKQAKLSEEEIAKRFNEINAKYKPGEEFSKKDAEFVKKYADNAPSNEEGVKHPQAANKSTSISAVRSKYGTKISIAGKIYHKGTFEYTYGGNLTVKKVGGKTPKKMTAYVECTSYGVVGNGGIGIVYSNKLSASAKKKNSLRFSKHRTYGGVIVLYRVSAYFDIVTSNGSHFTISG